LAEEAAVLEAQTAQRDGAKRATLDMMRGKKRAVDEFTVVLDPDEGPVSFLFRAVGNRRYDTLLSECPATTEQLARGETYDQDKFAPKLLAEVSEEPKLSVPEWAEIWKSPDWNRGEVFGLFNRATMLCLRGLDVGPTAAG
jgi:hypothetical protein